MASPIRAPLGRPCSAADITWAADVAVVDVRASHIGSRVHQASRTRTTSSADSDVTIRRRGPAGQRQWPTGSPA